MYRKWTPVFPIVHVMFVVDMDLSSESHVIIHKTRHPVLVGNREFNWLHILFHCFDKSTAPKGKTAVEVWYRADYDYWKELYTVSQWGAPYTGTVSTSLGGRQ